MVLGRCRDGATGKRDEAASQRKEGKDRTFQSDSPSVCERLHLEIAIAIPKNSVFGSCCKDKS